MKLLIPLLLFLLCAFPSEARMNAYIAGSVAAAGGGSGTFSIAASNDDTYAVEGVISNNTATNGYVGEGSAGTATGELAVRFSSVTIPKGTTITHAYLHVIGNDTLSGNSVKTRIYGQAADDGATFNTTYADVFGRTKTTAYADWTLPAMTAGTSYSSETQSVDLKDIITEIVARDGWASGQHIVLLLNDNGSNNYAYRTIRFWDYTGNASGATLEVTW